MPPTVTLRKGSGKLNVLKSGMYIPHGFDFNAKVSQLSCFWDSLVGQFYAKRENLRLRLAGADLVRILTEQLGGVFGV